MLTSTTALVAINFNDYLFPFVPRCHSVIVLTDPQTFELVPLLSPVELYQADGIRPSNLYPNCSTTNYSSGELIGRRIGYYWRLRTKRTCLAYFINFKLGQRRELYWKSLLYSLQDYWSVENFPGEKDDESEAWDNLDANYMIRFTGSAYLNVIVDLTGSSATLFDVAAYFYNNSRYFNSQTIRGPCEFGFRLHISSKFTKIYFHDLDPHDGFLGISCPCNPLASAPRKVGSKDFRPPTFLFDSSRFYSSLPHIMPHLNIEMIDALTEMGIRDSQCGNLKLEILATSKSDLPTDLSFFPNEWEFVRKIWQAWTEKEQDMLETLMLARIILKTSPNTTIKYVDVGDMILGTKDKSSSRYIYEAVKIDPKFAIDKLYEALYFPKVQIILNVNRPTTSEEMYYPTETIGFNFLACDVKVAELSLFPFVMPFELNVWLIFLVFMVFLLPVSIYFLLKTRQNIFLTMCSYFLEQSVGFKRKTNEYSVFVPLVGSLVLMCVVLTQTYKAVVTRDLLAPFLKVQLETFEEVLEYKSVIGKKLRILYDFEDDRTGVYTCFAMVDPNRCFYERPLLDQNEFFSRVDAVRQLQKDTYIFEELLERMFDNATRRITGTDTWKLGGCEGSVLTGKTNKLAHKLLEFKIQGGGKKFEAYAGKENIFPVGSGFSVRNLHFLGKSGFKRVSNILHSGIHKYLHTTFQHHILRATSAKVPTEQFQFSKLSITPSIQVLFYIHLTVIGIATSVFISECVHRTYELRQDILVNVLTNFRKIGPMNVCSGKDSVTVILNSEILASHYPISKPFGLAGLKVHQKPPP